MNRLLSILPAVLLSLTLLPAQQNVLLIIADDYGIDSSSLYNTHAAATQPPTPSIASLVTNGVLFANAYANPVCSPTRSCILTGRHGFRTGIGSVVGGPMGSPALAAGEFTLPDAFASASAPHHLAQFGKWHLATGAGSPLARGGWTNYAGGLGGALDDYSLWTKTVNGVSTSGHTNYATTDVVDDAVAWIQARGTNAWFAWVAFNAGHTPFHKPPNNLHSYDALSGTPLNINQNPRPYFEAMIEAMDTEIGRLLAAVNRTHTHIIFVGDNGTPGQVLQPPYPSGRAKGTLYEGGVHVPMIISGPRVVSAGRTNTTPVHVVDCFRTILELAGIDEAVTVPAGTVIDSESMLPLLEADVTLPRCAYMEQFNLNDPGANDGRALRNDRYKLIRFNNGTEALYDLQDDPYESANLLEGALDADPLADYHSLTYKLAAYQETLSQPVISDTSKEADLFTLTVTGEANLVYTLWRTTTFDALDWSPVTNAIIVSNSPTEKRLTDPAATAEHRFYRVLGEVP